mmetsp:Transcript_58178/g.162189  ORF Transcript_58178/g.162189 Transcript_58178/m.162189 type:complete len:232 (+) Transcript_58178:704-1399(+)
MSESPQPPCGCSGQYSQHHPPSDHEMDVIAARDVRLPAPSPRIDKPLVQEEDDEEKEEAQAHRVRHVCHADERRNRDRGVHDRKRVLVGQHQRLQAQILFGLAHSDLFELLRLRVESLHKYVFDAFGDAPTDVDRPHDHDLYGHGRHSVAQRVQNVLNEEHILHQGDDVASHRMLLHQRKRVGMVEHLHSAPDIAEAQNLERGVHRHKDRVADENHLLDPPELGESCSIRL